MFFENYFKIFDKKSIIDKKSKGFLRGIYEILLMNECYLDNIDKFKYIEVIDTDELIIPRVLEKYFPLEEMTFFDPSKGFEFLNSINDIDTKKPRKENTLSTNNNIIDYIYKIKHLFNISNSENIYFNDAYYISNEMIIKFFQKVERLQMIPKIFSSPYFIQVEYPLNNNINNVKKIVSSISIQSFIISPFKISNKEQNDYMNNLYYFYQKFFVKFFHKIKDSEASNHNRFFYIANNSISLGKTIYHTNEHVILSSHHNPNKTFKMFDIDYTYGHSSHFRNKFRIEKLKDNNWILDISQLYFDMNYFNYYYL